MRTTVFVVRGYPDPGTDTYEVGSEAEAKAFVYGFKCGRAAGARTKLVCACLTEGEAKIRRRDYDRRLAFGVPVHGGHDRLVKPAELAPETFGEGWLRETDGEVLYCRLPAELLDDHEEFEISWEAVYEQVAPPDPGDEVPAAGDLDVCEGYRRPELTLARDVRDADGNRLDYACWGGELAAAFALRLLRLPAAEVRFLFEREVVALRKMPRQLKYIT